MASFSLKLPWMTIWSCWYEGWEIVGADTTLESRTMASWPDGQAEPLELHWAAIALNELMASPPLMLRRTSQAPANPVRGGARHDLARGVRRPAGRWR